MSRRSRPPRGRKTPHRSADSEAPTLHTRPTVRPPARATERSETRAAEDPVNDDLAVLDAGWDELLV